MTDLQSSLTAAPAAVAGPTPTDHDQLRRPTWRKRGRSVLKHAALILVSLVMVYPLLWMLVSSFRPTEVIFRSPGLWVNDLITTNYTSGWNALSNPFGHYMVNSAVVVVGAVVGNLLSCSLAACRAAEVLSCGDRAGDRGRGGGQGALEISHRRTPNTSRRRS